VFHAHWRRRQSVPCLEREKEREKEREGGREEERKRDTREERIEKGEGEKGIGNGERGSDEIFFCNHLYLVRREFLAVSNEYVSVFFEDFAILLFECRFQQTRKSDRSSILLFECRYSSISIIKLC
jgi:hypothetical protein